MRGVLASIALGMGCGTTPDPDPLPTPIVPRAVMELTPTSIDFGERPLTGEAAARDVTIRNRGDAPLDVFELTFAEPDPAWSIGSIGQAFRIPPGSGRSFVVRFAPSSTGRFDNEVLIVSNVTPRGQEGVMPVSGAGISSNLVVEPELFVGDPNSPDRIPVEMRNGGQAPLLIQSFALSGNPGFSIDLVTSMNGSLPFDLAPLDVSTDRPVRTVYIDWNPDEADGDEPGVLTITSDAWENPVLHVSLVVHPS